MEPISTLLGYSPIDIHSHVDHGTVGDRSTIVTPEQLHTHIITLDFVRRRYDAVGIGSSVMSTYCSVLRNDHIREENDYLHRLVRETPWLYQWVVIHPQQEETFDQAARMLRQPKTLGIKIHPSCHGYDIMEHGDKLFSFANDLGTVVQMHPMHIDRMPELADKYPDMKLIIAHLGSDSYMDAVLRAKHGNIYVDTSGSASYQNNIIERAVERVGAEHILFGTDTYDPAFQLGRIVWAGITEADKNKILRENAMTMFPGAFR